MDDEVWDVYKKSWALPGVKTHAGLIRMLESYMYESSIEVLDDAEKSLVGDEPEPLVLREKGMIKERLLRRLLNLGFSKEVAEKLAEHFAKQRA